MSNQGVGSRVEEHGMVRLRRRAKIVGALGFIEPKMSSTLS
jgi:hypothetical protein